MNQTQNELYNLWLKGTQIQIQKYVFTEVPFHCTLIWEDDPCPNWCVDERCRIKPNTKQIKEFKKMKTFTAKELQGCYIENDYGILRDKFIEAARDAGYKPFSHTTKTCKFIYCNHRGYFVGSGTLVGRQLTLDDFVEKTVVDVYKYFNGQKQHITQQGNQENLILYVTKTCKDDVEKGSFTLGHTMFDKYSRYKVCTIEEYNAFVEQKVPKYTQDMVDAKQRCEVGMQCLIEVTKGAEKEAGELLGWHGKEVWVMLYDGMCTTVIKSDTPCIFPMVPEVVKTSKELLESCISNILFEWIHGGLMGASIDVITKNIMHDIEVYKS